MAKMKLDSEEESNLDPKVNVITQELRFAKLLAGNSTDVDTKTKQINRLKLWLKHRVKCSQPFTDKNYKRLWKGLFYSMWMADKPLPQENLATNIASLVHCFDEVNVGLQFFATFLNTMANEWLGIDQWRIDKFMMLIRKITREVFVLIKDHHWNESMIKEFSKKLHETVLLPKPQRGLFMHFTELYMEELAKVSEGDLSTETIIQLLRPFMEFVATNKESKLIKYVIRHVFNHLLFQSEAGREYQEKYDAWKAMGFPGNSVDDIVLDEVKNEGDLDNVDDAEDDAVGDDNVSNDETKDDKILDPRAGRVNVDMPELTFDALKIAEFFEDFKYKKETRTKNRKSIDRVVSTFKKFSTGKFPIGIQKLKIDRSELELPSIDQKAEELLKFEDELLREQRKIKKLNKKKRKKLLKLSGGDDIIEKSPKRSKLKHKANEWQEEDIDPNESIDSENKKTKITNGKPVINDDKKVNNNNISVQMKKKKQENNKKQKKNPSNVENNKKSPAKTEWNAALKEGEIEYFIPSKKIKLEQANISLKIKRVGDKMEIISEIKQPLCNGSDEMNTKNETSTPSNARSNNKISTPTKSSTSTPLKKEKNLSTPSKKHSNDSTPSTSVQNNLPKPVIVSSEKKVKIMLKMNTSQEATEYINQLKQSPQLPYDSSKKPLKGVLKPNLMPSPINPFYRKMLGLYEPIE